MNLVENTLILFIMSVTISVVAVKNPIGSLLCLVLTFFLSFILFLIMGIEFISLLIFMIYIGAIAILFLFIVMMLNIKIVELKSLYLRYLPVGSFIILFFFLALCFFLYNQFFFCYDFFYFFNWIVYLNLLDNIILIGYIMYTYLYIYFLIIILILLLSMIGSIVLVINWESEKNNKLYIDIYNLKNIKFFS